MKSSRTHSDIITDNFGPQAEAYLVSAVHAAGEDLVWLNSVLEAHPAAELLDLGCGGGHVSYTAAPRVRNVTAYDMSGQMLQVVEQAAKERGLANVVTRQGVAESLPFADAVFDLVVSRYSAHHWHDVPKAMREVYRVLKPGGLLLLMDVVSPGHPVLDIYLQTVEMLRDTSHVRDYSPGEWLCFMNEAQLHAEELRSFRLHLEFTSWITRMRTPEHFAHAIRELQNTASQEVRSYYGIAPDGSFAVDCVMLKAQKRI